MASLSDVLNTMRFSEGFLVLQALKALENTAYKLEEESERYHCAAPVAVPSARHKGKHTARGASPSALEVLGGWGEQRNQSGVGQQVRVKTWKHLAVRFMFSVLAPHEGIFYDRLVQ